MNTWIEPPPPQRKGMGCFARAASFCSFRACLDTGLLRGSLLGLSAALGSRARSLFPGENARDYRFAETRSAIQRSRTEIQAVKGRWQNFEHAVRERQPVEIELTADDINGLIAANRHARGKAFVSIEGNRLSLQTSLPLNKYLGQSRYYLSGDITIQSDAAASLAKPRLESVAVNSQPVPHDLLDWKYRSRSLRDYLAEYSPIPDVGTIQIRDGKVILRSRGE